MKRYWPGGVLFCLLLAAGCSSAQDGSAPSAPLRHVALSFDQRLWSTAIEGPGPEDSNVLMILDQEHGVALTITEFESFKPTRIQAVVAKQLRDELPTQFRSVAPAGPDLPARGLALPDDWTCDHHVVAKQPGSETRAYTSCVHSTMLWFANLVVITPVDATEDEIEAANAVLASIRTN